MLVGALGFLNANDQNEVRLPVVKFLASQRASSIQTLVTYFIVVRLVLINRISLQHYRPVDYVQEPNAEQVPRVGSCLEKPTCVPVVDC